MIPSKLCIAAFAVALAGGALCQTAWAQTVAGSLPRAGGPNVSVVKKSHLLKKVTQVKSRSAEKAKPPALEPWAAVDPGRVAPPSPPESQQQLPNAAAADDPKPSNQPDLAMKWNGNNDTATQTRVRNYGGDAEGTGAAMGLKFHF